MRTTRRQLLQTAAGAGLGLAAPAVARGELLATSRRRVVVIGGGWGGATAAKTVRRLDPEIEVVLIERESVFRSCPTSNWVIGNLWDMSRITRGYEDLVRRHDVRLITAEVRAIDIAAGRVRLDEGEIRYDRLIVSPGVELVYDGIEGLGAGDAPSVPAAWKAGAETEILRRQIAALPERGTVAMTVPLSPYRCPPGPYERACLIADYLKRHKPGARLVVLDANARIVSKGKLFAAAWKELYDGVIDYRPDQQLVGVDVAGRRVRTAFDEVAADVLNVIPPQRAPALLREAGLVPAGERWAPVSARSFVSPAAPAVHIVGDATDQRSVGRVPKSGFVANSMGKVAAAAAVALLNGREPAEPTMANTCYSLVSAEEGISVTALYRWDEAAARYVVPEGASGTSPARTREIARNATDWAETIWNDMLA